jgi:acid stress-induced BolA-like protein IbaG/YrbA
MQTEEIKQLIESGIPGCEAIVSGDGSHFEAIVVGEVFAGKSMLEQQKLVYATLGEHITSGAIHALSIKAYTPEEWHKAQKLNVTGG